MSDSIGSKLLGLASIAIGITEIAAPQQLENYMGISNGENTGILRVLGVREILTGVDILAHPNSKPGIWGRVAGDAVDIALLAIAAKKSKNPTGMKTIFTAVAGITALDVLCANKTRERLA